MEPFPTPKNKKKQQKTSKIQENPENPDFPGFPPSLLSRDTGATCRSEGAPNGYMLLLGAGGEGTWTGPSWS